MLQTVCTWFCVLNDAKQKEETFTIKNNLEGLAKFKNILSKYGKEFKIGLESSCVYCHGIK